MKLKEYFIKYARLIPLSTSVLMKLGSKKVIFPFYHGVSDCSLSYIRQLYSIKSEKEFKEDLDYLLKWFEPINLKSFKNHISNKTRLIENSFILTFDDGLSSFYDVVAPILLEKKIPAINFLNKNFIDNKQLFYRFKVSLLIERILKIKENEECFAKISKILNIHTISDTICWLKESSIKDDSVLDDLGIILEVSFNDFLKNEAPFLTKNQIKKLIEQGFYFGGHSVSHPLYKQLHLKNQLAETIDSVNYVCDEFGLDQKVFSFPFSDDAISKEFFIEINSEQIISFGSAGLKDEDLDFHFQRIPMEYSKNYSAKQIIKGELLYYILKKMVGYQRIKRSKY